MISSMQQVDAIHSTLTINRQSSAAAERCSCASALQPNALQQCSLLAETTHRQAFNLISLATFAAAQRLMPRSYVMRAMR
jgi:hypothetical protein